MKTKVITSEIQISETELASLGGVTTRRVRQLCQEGKLPVQSEGLLPALDAIKRLIAYYRSNDEAMRSEKLALVKAKREREQLALMRETGELCFTKQVQKLWDATVIEARAMVQASDIPEHVKQSLLTSWRSIGEKEYLGGQTVEEVETEVED